MKDYLMVDTRLFDTDLSPTEILLLAVLEDSGHKCYLTNQELAKALHIAIPTVAKMLHQLEAKHYIKRDTKFKIINGSCTKQRTIEREFKY